MSKFKQGDKIKVKDSRSAEEKSRKVIGQGKRFSGYEFKDSGEACRLSYGEVLKVSESTKERFLNRNQSVPLINADFANAHKGIFEIVESSESE